MRCNPIPNISKFKQRPSCRMWVTVLYATEFHGGKTYGISHGDDIGFPVEYSMKLSWNATFSTVIRWSIPHGVPWRNFLCFCPHEILKPGTYLRVKSTEYSICNSTESPWSFHMTCIRGIKILWSILHKKSHGVCMKNFMFCTHGILRGIKTKPMHYAVLPQTALS